MAVCGHPASRKCKSTSVSVHTVGLVASYIGKMYHIKTEPSPTAMAFQRSRMTGAAVKSWQSSLYFQRSRSLMPQRYRLLILHLPQSRYHSRTTAYFVNQSSSFGQ